MIRTIPAPGPCWAGRAAAARAGALALMLAVVGAARAAGAQGSSTVLGGRPGDWSFASVASEEENYMRVLQVAGIARLRPWSIRPFAPGELAALLPDSARHPWASRSRFARGGGVRATVFGPGGALAYNSGFPLSMNDGAVWTGRGLTAIATAGAAARWGALSVRLEPVAFWSANRPVPLVPNGYTGAPRFGDALNPYNIDAPQRFGDRPYARLDPGQSTVRLDLLGVAVGATTANGWVGPAIADPLVLGNNAAGYPRLFAGTARPLRMPLGTVHLRVDAGRLDQSAYSTAAPDSTRRLGSSVALVVTPGFSPGLEVGGVRYFHQAWNGWGRLGPGLKAATAGFFIPGDQDAVPQNQLSSVFARWVFPEAGAEVWGEYMRNDASANSRDLAVEPDHNAGWMVGTRRVWRRPSGALVSARLEHLDTRVTHLAALRVQTRPYEHNELRQGHTSRGEVLGSFSGQGGLATTAGVDVYVPDGRWTFEVSRRTRQSSLRNDAAYRAWDVYQILRAERLRAAAVGDLFAGASGVWELNRDFGKDAYSLRLDLGIRLAGRRVR